MSRLVDPTGGASLPPEVNPDDCDCPDCLMADLERHLTAIGFGNPGQYTQPPPTWRGDPNCLKLTALPPLADLPPMPVLPARDRVPVRVEDIGAGVWAHVTGVDRAGAPLTVAGAVVGGPDLVPAPWTVPNPASVPVPGETIAQRIRRERVAHAAAGQAARARVYVVQVRDYRAGVDRLVHVPAGGTVDLVDDPADHSGRAAHAVAPVFGPAARVHLYRSHWQRRGRDLVEVMRLETHEHPTAAHLHAWEHGGGGVELSAVHRAHLPVWGGV